MPNNQDPATRGPLDGHLDQQSDQMHQHFDERALGTIERFVDLGFLAARAGWYILRGQPLPDELRAEGAAAWKDFHEHSNPLVLAVGAVAGLVLLRKMFEAYQQQHNLPSAQTDQMTPPNTVDAD